MMCHIYSHLTKATILSKHITDCHAPTYNMIIVLKIYSLKAEKQQQKALTNLYV